MKIQDKTNIINRLNDVCDDIERLSRDEIVNLSNDEYNDYMFLITLKRKIKELKNGSDTTTL